MLEAGQANPWVALGAVVVILTILWQVLRR
jgi:hypothetical protein